MGKRNRVLIFTFCLLVLASSVGAQIATRIKFRKGAATATISAHLSNFNDKKVFVIRVGKGQTLKTAQVKNNSSRHYVTVSIKNPAGKTVGDSDASCNNRKVIEPTVAGDYKITIFECRKADAWRGRFYLKVTVK